MRKTLFIVFILALLSGDVLAQDKISKQPNVQIVIHRQSIDKPGETYELFYNPRELGLPYSTKDIFGLVEEVQDLTVCYNIEWSLEITIYRQTKKQYSITLKTINGKDFSQGTHSSYISTTFNLPKEGGEILKAILISSSQDIYQISVRSTRYHASQGGFVLQCEKITFPTSIR